MPTSRDYFDWFEFVNECAPELSRRQRILIEMLEKAIPDENTVDKLTTAASYYANEAQYTGFMQGIRLAAALLCENN